MGIAWQQRARTFLPKLAIPPWPPSLTFSTCLENPEGAKSLYAVGIKATEMDRPLGPSYSPQSTDCQWIKLQAPLMTEGCMETPTKRTAMGGRVGRGRIRGMADQDLGIHFFCHFAQVFIGSSPIPPLLRVVAA